MKTWISPPIPTLVIAMALAAGNGLAQEKNSLSEGRRSVDASSEPRAAGDPGASDPRASITVAN